MGMHTLCLLGNQANFFMLYVSCLSSIIAPTLESGEFAPCVGGLGLSACRAPCVAGSGALGVLVPLYCHQHSFLSASCAAVALL